MNKLSSVLLLSLLVAVFIFAALPVTAYERYNGSNSCVQCHDGFEGGFGSELHDGHNQFANCGDCHDDNGDNPLIENCASCHIPNPLWNAHNEAPTDQHGLSCSTCHTFVSGEAFSWGETKALFR